MAETAVESAADPGQPEPQFFNMELSWLRFNQRVLEEALRPDTPLLERVRFLAIYANNLDEFFMVRISGLVGQLSGGAVETPPDGMTPLQQLMAVREDLTGRLKEAEELWRDDLLPKLWHEGIRIFPYEELNDRQRRALHDFFAREVFPVLTPLAFDPAHPFPHISNLSLNLAVVVKDDSGRENFARLKVADVFPRLVPIPGEGAVEVPGDLAAPAGGNFVWLEDLVAANLEMLFPGLEVEAAYPFRITRDADFDIKDEGALDLLSNIEQLIELRQWGNVIRLEIDQRTPERIREILMRNLELSPYQVYQSQEHLGFADLMELTRIDLPVLKFPPFVPNVPAALTRKENVFDLITEDGILLYHPYDSFTPVVELIREAANDPNVLAIKQTLYRVGANSPIVDALMEARQHGKQVAVLLELQARFDEEHNIAWARALEDEGVHVVYGVVGLKTHAKMSMVVRREADGLKRYVHLGTGNYNTVTSRIYTDLSYFTCDETIGADVADLFNSLTGYARKESFRKLLVAPGNLRHEVIERIKREVRRHREHGDGYLAFKMNALVDKKCILALYEASQEGVKIDLQVRGMCCLKPGIPGLSETITVTSIVGRFLEHARIYYFLNGGKEEVLLGSADLMPRNLDRRVEVLFPVESPELRKRLRDEILEVHLRDTKQARRLLPDGSYERVLPPEGEEPFGSQEWLMEHWRGLE
ncbi:MAG TPA: polyphosphate kinase 1 [Dehalococcoidia bacterium]|nr:polyphosphate kinase 1 [Dehalococcoidia bacterium]